MEKTERLWDGGPVLLHGDNVFPPSTDTFLLGYFARVRRGERVCDLGAGGGLLGTLLLARQRELTVTAVELQEAGCDTIRRAAACNGWEDRLLPWQADLRQAQQLPHTGSFDAVVTNPPYFPAPRGVLSPDRQRQSTRAECTCTLEDICRAASRLLRSGGRFSLVMPPQRMAELFGTAQKVHLEPKRMRTVHFDPAAAPSLFLLECRKDGHTGLTMESPLFLRDGQGQETQEYQRIYFRAR